MSQAQLVGLMVSNHMNEIVDYFVEGAEVTVIVRIPGNDDADFMMTNDDLEQITALVQRRYSVQSDRQCEPAPSVACPDLVFIWSNEHQAYWRPKSAGYTIDGLGAGVYSRSEGEAIQCGVGPEKQLQLIPAADRASGILSALTAQVQPARGDDWLSIDSCEAIGLANRVIVAVTCSGREPTVGEAWRSEDGQWWWAGSSPDEWSDSPISEINFGTVSHWMPLPDASALWHSGGS